MRKHMTIFLLVGILYLGVEVTYSALTPFQWAMRGQSSLWMFIVGGYLGVLLGFFNENGCFLRKWDFRLKVVLGALAITATELVSGLVLNKLCGFGLWDYSGARVNLLGQIDALHTLYWFILTPLVFWLDCVIEHYMFGASKPRTLLSFYGRALLG